MEAYQARHLREDLSDLYWRVTNGLADLDELTGKLLAAVERILDHIEEKEDEANA